MALTSTDGETRLSHICEAFDAGVRSFDGALARSALLAA